MKPEEKAKDLFVKNIELVPDYIRQIDAKHIAKECALIAVNEIMDALYYCEVADGYVDDWKEVKQELEKI
jgi:hypothetical protein